MPDIDLEDAELIAKAKELLAYAKHHSVDPRILNLLELIGEPDGLLELHGQSYSVDGNDVSTSIGGTPPSQVLYLLGGSTLILAAPGDREAISRISIADALLDPLLLVELGEILDD